MVPLDRLVLSLVNCLYKDRNLQDKNENIVPLIGKLIIKLMITTNPLKGCQIRQSKYVILIS